MRTANETKIQQAQRDHQSRASDGPGRAAAGHDVQGGEGVEEARTALDAALDNKALEPILLDVRGLCSYTNYILLVSGRSDRHVESICDGIMKTMREHGHYPLGTEGKQSGQWALADFGDCVVHIFYHPTREHYDLEGLWIDAPRVPIEVPEEARITKEDAH